jgi:hypothetical protein
MSDGLKLKYKVTKPDGTPCTGNYFVLKLDSKDPANAKASQKAVLKYAQKTKNKQLRKDLRLWVKQITGRRTLRSFLKRGTRCSDMDRA